MKNKILNLPFKKLTSLFTAIVFFCNIIAPLPAMAQKNQPKKKLTLEQKIASIKENVTVDGIEKFKSEVERLLEKGKGVLSPEECWAAKPQTMKEYVAKCLYGGAFSEDDEIIKVKSQKPYAYEEIKELYSDFNGQFQNSDSNKRIEMLEESLADIFPEYYQNEKAMVFAYRELENFLKKQTESYMNELLSPQYPKDWYAKIPSAFYPFPSAKSTIKNSLHFSQEGKGKLSKFFHYNMILSMTDLDYCDPKDFFANEQNTFPDLFRKSYTARLSIPETTEILKIYTTNSITQGENYWIKSEPISQMILARYLKEFSSTPESPVMLEYYMLLGFADMLGSQVSYVHSRLEQDLDVANENDIKRYYWACQYALDKFEEYKNHLKQGNSDAGVAALKDIAETSGLLCFSNWWRQDGDIEKWEKDYLSKLIHYSYGMRHWQVRRVIDITTANAYLLMKALIYVDRYYGSNSTPDQPLPSEMQRIIEPILEKITGEYLTWKDFEKVFRGETLTTENINKEGAARHVTFGENLKNLADGPIGNGGYYYAKNGVDNAWEDTKKQGGAALGMLQYLSPSFYIFGEAFKTDGDFAKEVATKSFSARTADFVSGLLELHKPVVPSIYPRIARVDPSRYWVDIIKHGPCDIGNKDHPNMSAVNNESCGIVDRALSQFDGRYGVYDEKDGKHVHSTAQEKERIKKSVNFYEEAGKFARDFAVDAVVDYVLFFGMGTIAKFFNAGKATNVAKTAAKVNSSTGNVKVPNKSYVPKNKPTGTSYKTTKRGVPTSGKRNIKGNSKRNSKGNSRTLGDKRNARKLQERATRALPEEVPPTSINNVSRVDENLCEATLDNGEVVRFPMKEGQKLEHLDDGRVVIKDATGHPVDDFPNLSEFKKHYTHGELGGWWRSQAAMEAQSAIGKFLKENGHLLGDPKNYKKLGQAVANDQRNFRRLFKDNVSAKLANELVKKGKHKELGKLVDDAVTPFLYKSPASGMADDIRYLSITLEKTPDGIKASSSVEIPLGEISQWDNASDFLKSNTQSYELMDEFELSEFNTKKISEAKPNKNGTYQISLKNTNGKIFKKSIEQLEYKQLKQLAEQGKGGRFVMLKKNTWKEMRKTVKQLDDEIITPHLNKQMGNSKYNVEYTRVRGGPHESGDAGRTDYVFLKVENGTQHIHIEKKINFELNGKTYTTIYNVNVPIKIESEVMGKIFRKGKNGIKYLSLLFLSGVSVAGMGEASDELYQEP